MSEQEQSKGLEVDPDGNMETPILDYLRALEATQNIKVTQITIMRDDSGEIKRVFVSWLPKWLVEGKEPPWKGETG